MKLAFTTGNLLRKEKYRLLTTVYENRGNIFVRKSAASSLSLPHLRQIVLSKDLLEKSLPNLKFVKTLKSQKSLIEYEYLFSPTLSQLIEEALIDKNFERAFDLVKIGLEVILTLETKKINPYESKSFSQLFDPKKSYEKGDELCSLIAPLDIRHDNLLLKNKDLFLIDYEWVYDFPIPLKFLQLRSLFYLANSFQMIIDTLCSQDFPCIKILDSILIPTSWFNLISLTQDEAVRFLFYENNFQNMINLTQSVFHPTSILKDTLPITNSQNLDLNVSSKQKTIKTLILENEVNNLRRELMIVHQELNMIKSSKFFKAWQHYTKFKDKLKKPSD